MAAANRLLPEAIAGWQSGANTGQTWQQLVAELRRAPPIPYQQLHGILATLQQLAADAGTLLAPTEQTRPNRVRDAGLRTPNGTLIHLPWALDLLQQPDGYVPATAQEALLQAFFGEHLASAAATLASQWHSLTNRSVADLPPPSPTHIGDACPPQAPSPAPPSSSPTSSSHSSSSTSDSSSDTSPTSPASAAHHPVETVPHPHTPTTECGKPPLPHWT